MYIQHALHVPHIDPLIHILSFLECVRDILIAIRIPSVDSNGLHDGNSDQRCHLTVCYLMLID